MEDPRKAYFDAARSADEDGILVLDDINKIHAVLDLAGIARVPLKEIVGPAAKGVGPDGLNLIMRFEGCQRKLASGMIAAYPDPGTNGDPWTIGWGATHMDGRRVAQGDLITQEKADQLLREHLKSYGDEVRRAIGDAKTSQMQFDALLSFHYNTGAIRKATLTKKHIAGDYAGAAREFARWNRAGGRVMKGLVRRRQAEAELYLRGTA